MRVSRRGTRPITFVLLNDFCTVRDFCTSRCRYVILPKDFEKGYKANVKKSDTEFAFYQ